MLLPMMLGAGECVMAMVQVLLLTQRSKPLRPCQKARISKANAGIDKKSRNHKG